MGRDEVLKPYSDITIEDIVTGKSYGNVTLNKFRTYLHDIEHSVENLEFTRWFLNYEARYYTVMGGGPPGFIPLKPPVEFSLLSLDIDNEAGSVEQFTKPPEYIIDLEKYAVGSKKFKLNRNFLPTLGTKWKWNISKKLKFYSELKLINSIFFNPQSIMELNIPGEMKDRLVQQIVTSCHPDLFIDIYRHCYQLLKTNSLPLFLAKISEMDQVKIPPNNFALTLKDRITKLLK